MLGQKKNLVKKILVKNNLEPKKIGSKKSFGQKKFLGPKKSRDRENCWSKKILGPKKFGSKRFEPKQILDQKKFWLKNLGKNNLGSE